MKPEGSFLDPKLSPGLDCTRWRAAASGIDAAKPGSIRTRNGSGTGRSRSVASSAAKTSAIIETAHVSSVRWSAAEGKEEIQKAAARFARSSATDLGTCPSQRTGLDGGVGIRRAISKSGRVPRASYRTNPRCGTHAIWLSCRRLGRAASRPSAHPPPGKGNPNGARCAPGGTAALPTKVQGRWVGSFATQARTYSTLNVDGKSASLGMPNHSGIVSLSKIRKRG